MQTKSHYAQGDVTLVPVEKLPEGCTVAKDSPTVEYGEATGHHHTFRNGAAQVLIAPDGRKFVKVNEGGAVLEHQEHPPLQVEEPQKAFGSNFVAYEYKPTREYRWGETLRVRD